MTLIQRRLANALDRERWRAAFESDAAQDSFEYLLVIGGAVLVLILALLAFDTVVAEVLGASCPSVDTAKGIAATAGSCLQ